MAYKPKTLIVSEGGSGVVSNTAYAVLTGGTTSTGAIQSIAGVGTSGQVLTSNGSSNLPTFQDAPSTGGSSNEGFSFFTDFTRYSPPGINVQVDDFYTMADSATTGSQVINTPGTATNPGLMILETGTNSAGWTCIFTHPSGLLFGGGVLEVEILAKLPTLSDATDTYTLYVGFGDHALTGAEPVDGAYFKYIHSLNAGQFQIKTANNSTRTTTNTFFTVTTNFIKYKVSCNAGGTSVDYYLNDTIVASGPITTNIPTAAGREFGIIYKITKSVGTANRTGLVDYISINNTLTAAR